MFKKVKDKLIIHLMDQPARFTWNPDHTVPMTDSDALSIFKEQATNPLDKLAAPARGVILWIYIIATDRKIYPGDYYLVQEEDESTGLRWSVYTSLSYKFNKK